MKVELLPLRTELPGAPQQHRHDPPKSSWKHYRTCLRWEFGFTCAFCMLHEADLAEHGIEREHAVGIEHFQRRESSPDLADVYENCFLACTLCNEDRGRHPNTDKHGRNLLDPSKTAWVEHFVWQDNGRLRPKPRDRDAEYTFRAYKLDHPKKHTRHVWRRDILRGSRRLLDKLPALINKLHEEARGARNAGNFGTARQKLREASDWRQVLATAAKQLRRFSAVPKDHPTRCRCGDEADMTLPAWLAQQTIAVTLPDIAEE